MKEKLLSIYQAVDGKFAEQFEFHVKDVTLQKVIDYMYKPKDSSSLAVTRILFGLAMVFDVPDERGGAIMDKRWDDPNLCHFPLIPWIQAAPMPFMAFVYAALWIGAFGIMLGYKYRITAPIFTICYWYLFLIEKSYWNNHSYLFGLVALLLSCTEANCYWSLDVYFKSTQEKTTVPYWNYFILKYQFFILYFMAGMKKGTTEWLTGYSVQNLSEHWVFDPFKIFLTVAQTDYLIVHWFIFVFDLTIAMWMMWSRTRHVAMIFCALFHLMNSRLFAIGMFPWVCLATMPLFYPFNWPKFVINNMNESYRNVKNIIGKQCKIFHECGARNEQKKITGPKDNREDSIVKNCKILEKIYVNSSGEISEKNNRNNSTSEETNVILRKTKDNKDPNERIYKNPKPKQEYEHKKITIFLIFIYVFIQAFLPYSHFITKGYNNWTNGLYGYSWDMMVHTWDIQSVIIKIVDNDNEIEFFIDPYIYAPNDRWTRHSDMVYQYAKCLKNNLLRIAEESYRSNKPISENISIYVDVWCSLNGRFAQRVFDPKIDIIKAVWSPLHKPPYLMNLIDEALSWRSVLDAIRKDVYSWSNYSDVMFYAEFPGYYQGKYIPEELYNITVTALQGRVAFEAEISYPNIGQSVILNSGDQIKMDSGLFHKIINIGDKPAFYMYTFTNSSELNEVYQTKPKLPIFKELHRRLEGMALFVNLIINYFLRFIFYYCGCQ